MSGVVAQGGRGWTAAAEVPATALRGAALAGAAGLVLLLGVLGGWAATTVIAGAVVAHGQTVAEGRTKVVQHQDGGIVSAILVENGDRVAEGDLLLRLDPTTVALNLDVARTRLAAALAERARLLAEQAGAGTLDLTPPPLPPAVLARPLDLDAHEAGQRRILEARAALLDGGRARLAETLEQLDRQAEGLRGQVEAAREQLALLDGEVESQERLVEQGLARQSALSEARRARAALAGDLASQEAEIGRIAVQKRDAELATLQEEGAFRERVATDLREVTDEVEELVLEIVTRQAQLDRMEVRAPAAGVVHELAVTTVGGVVAPGATLLQIVPQDGPAEFELRVSPSAVDQVEVGQEADLVLSGLDRQTTPRLLGRVVTVSAAAIPDPQTGHPFFRVEVDVTPEEVARLGPEATLIPGMPVEAFLRTGDRTVLSYLLHPLVAHMRRAFRD